MAYGVASVLCLHKHYTQTVCRRETETGVLILCVHVSHLVSLAFVFREKNDGVGQRGGRRLHLLHHDLSRAVDGEDVAGEVLAGPPCCSAGRTGDCRGTDMLSKQVPTTVLYGKQGYRYG